MDRHRRALNRLPPLFVGLLAAPATVLIGVFYVWPVATLAARAIGGSAIRDAFDDPAVRSVVWFTTWQAALSTLATVVVGLVPAWLLARFEFRGRRAVTAVVTVPFVLPTVVVGAAFLAVLPDSLDQTATAIVIAHVFFNVAVVVRGVGGMWAVLPPDLTAAARTLGASPWRAFREVTVPLLWPSILAAASVVFLFCFTSFGVVRVLGGPANTTLEVEIWQRATRFGEIGVASVLSLAQLVVLGLSVAWFARLQRRRATALGLRPMTSRRRARTRRSRLGLAMLVAAVTATMTLPIAAMVERSFRTGSGHSTAAWRAVFGAAAPAGGRPTAATVNALAAIGTSLRFAVIAMGISVIAGAAVSFAIAASGRIGSWLDGAVMLPLGTSAVTIGFGLLVTFDHHPVDWRAAPLMIPLGHALVATPFVVRTVLPMLRSIDPRQRDAAASLGASPLRAWREIDLRVCARPLVTGAAFAMAISLGEFGATTFLTRQGRVALPIAIEQLLNRPGALLHAQGYALAVVLAALTFVVALAVGTDRNTVDGDVVRR